MKTVPQLIEADLFCRFDLLPKSLDEPLCADCLKALQKFTKRRMNREEVEVAIDAWVEKGRPHRDL